MAKGFFTEEELSKKVSSSGKRNITIINIDYSKLITNENQYKEDSLAVERAERLAMQILADGEVIEPLIVRQIDKDKYEIIAGHTRRDACKYLVEKVGLDKFSKLPCMIRELSDVRAEFQLYSSNCHSKLTPYEQMIETAKAKYLLDNFPEEFPDYAEIGGRKNDYIADMQHRSKSSIGEDLALCNNLSDSAKEQFKNGSITRKEALAIAQLEIAEQNRIVNQGVDAIKQIKKKKESENGNRGLKPETKNNDQEKKTAVKEDYILPGQIEFKMPGTLPVLPLDQSGAEQLIEYEKAFLTEMIRDNAAENIINRQKLIIIALQAYSSFKIESVI